MPLYIRVAGLEKAVLINFKIKKEDYFTKSQSSFILRIGIDSKHSCLWKEVLSAFKFIAFQLESFQLESFQLESFQLESLVGRKFRQASWRRPTPLFKRSSMKN
jgi:hypothetical protein